MPATRCVRSMSVMPTDPQAVRLGRAVIGGLPTLIVSSSGGTARLDDIIDDPPTTLIDLLGDWEARGAEVKAGLEAAEPADPPDIEAWLAPLSPPKLLCIGANYHAHNAEMLGEVKAEFPYLFLKPPSTTVVPTGATISVPTYAVKLDYEAELAVIAGSDGSAIGYTTLNDLSVRDWVPGATILGIDWVMAKGFDGSAPLGPWVLPAEYVPDPQDLRIQLWVNDELRQDGNTADMVFSVQECMDHLNRVLTLEAGDVIATGTPAGVGMGDGRYLKAGDVIRIEIEGLGTQESTLVAQ